MPSEQSTIWHSLTTPVQYCRGLKFGTRVIVDSLDDRSQDRSQNSQLEDVGFLCLANSMYIRSVYEWLQANSPKGNRLEAFELLG